MSLVGPFPADLPFDPVLLEPLPPSFYKRPAAIVAAELLGRFVVRREGTGLSILELVETEAYLGEGDRASHAHRGPRTPRSRKLYRNPGLAYVYLIYGMHYCLNVVTGSDEDGSAVLLRAGAARYGLETMLERRRLGSPPRRRTVASGPGRLAQALGVDGGSDGQDLGQGELWLAKGRPVPETGREVGRRVGIDYAGEATAWPLRFGVRGEGEVSRPPVIR